VFNSRVGGISESRLLITKRKRLRGSCGDKYGIAASAALGVPDDTTLSAFDVCLCGFDPEESVSRSFSMLLLS